jgi:hypothetical protein
MKDLLIFGAIVVFGIIPFGTTVVYTLYRKTIVFPAAMLVFLASMFCAIVAFAVSEFGFLSLVWAIPLSLAVLLSSNFFIKKLLQWPLKDLKTNMDEAKLGNLNLTIASKTSEPNHEIGYITRSFMQLIESMNKIASFSDEIARNNFNFDYELLGDKDKIGIALLNMKDSLLKAREAEQQRKVKEEQENWIAQGIAKFSDILRSNSQNLNELSRLFIIEMVNYLDIVQGGLFVLNEEDSTNIEYELRASVAYSREKTLHKKFRIGESLVGRCAYEKLPIYMTEVPEDYVTVTSGLGTSNPRSIALIPAVMENKVYGVIELVSFHTFSDYQIDFIKRVGENLASTISMVRINEQTSKLLEESKIQQEELAAQEEEMRQNMEELIATQEEMKRKEDKLRQILDELGLQDEAMKERIEQINNF